MGHTKIKLEGGYLFLKSINNFRPSGLGCHFQLLRVLLLKLFLERVKSFNQLVGVYLPTTSLLLVATQNCFLARLLDNLAVHVNDGLPETYNICLLPDGLPDKSA